MARIGLLMLNRGKWNDKQVISSNWVDKMVTEWTKPKDNKNLDIGNIKTSIDMGNGYMWWSLNSNKANPKFKNAYNALGYLGQAIAVFPEINTVVVYKTKSDYKRTNNPLNEWALFEKAVNIYDTE